MAAAEAAAGNEIDVWRSRQDGGGGGGATPVKQRKVRMFASHSEFVAVARHRTRVALAASHPVPLHQTLPEQRCRVRSIYADL